MGSNRARRADDKRLGSHGNKGTIYPGEVTRKAARGRWIDRATAAKLMDVTTARVSQLVSAGKIAVRRFGRYVEVDSQDCEDYRAGAIRRPGTFRLNGSCGSITADRLEAVLRRVADRDCAQVPVTLEVALLLDDDDLRDGLVRLLLDVGVCTTPSATRADLEGFETRNSAEYQRWLDGADLDAVAECCVAYLERRPLPEPGLTAPDRKVPAGVATFHQVRTFGIRKGSAPRKSKSAESDEVAGDDQDAATA